MRRVRQLSYLGGAALATALGASIAVGASQSSTLANVLLRPGQVGRGYVLKMIPGGRIVHGQVTLDMCGFRFRSESSRIARLQAVYDRRGTSLYLSNEVVRYRPGGAAFAMSEITSAIRTCPHRPVSSHVRGVPNLTYRIQRLTASGRHLLAGAIVMKVTEWGTLNGKKVRDTSFVVYERSGDVLSGIYVYGGSLSERHALAIRAASVSAHNLRGA